jgi:glycyl-tRNA synthetase
MAVQKNEKMEAIVSLAKRRGFIYQGSEVYGGLSGTWDYGPLGVTLKRNIMNLWWKMFVDDRDDMYGVDAAILMNQKVWQASGHVDTFSDPMVECRQCKTRFRMDHLFNPDSDEYKRWFKDDFIPRADQQISETKTILEGEGTNYSGLDGMLAVIKQFEDGKKNSKDEYVINDYMNAHVKCQRCGSQEWTNPKQFNMMFETNVGPVTDDSSVSYLRPETAQGIFTNYKNVVDSFYPDLPFGIAQQGKAFRNEISPRDFIFRSREFEQMEIEYFVHPDKWEKSFGTLLADIHAYLAALGLPKDMIHELDVPAEDRAHYSKRTVDIEFDFPIGKEELMGLAYRTDFDLDNIQRVSGKGMDYNVKGTNEKFVPHVIEPSFGVERALMAVLTAAYTEDEVNGEKRIFLKFPEHLAPVKFAVSPLLKNKPELVEKAREVYQILKKKHGNVMWDDNGNIGKRYRRQDEIGTPYCVVIDFDTLDDDTVTIRDRDTTEQKRVPITEL